MASSHILATLNPEQAKAVRSVEGRLLILAGAGSGKTSVLTRRMAYLILECGVPPEALLGLTFTNKAAQEMRHRVATLVSPEAAGKIAIHTFHSFCMHVLRQDIDHLGFTKEFSLYDAKDLERLVKLVAHDLLEHEGALPSLAGTLQLISKAANQGAAPPAEGTTWHDKFTQELYQRLTASFRAYNALDFDHLLQKTVELFQLFPSVLAKYQERFRYLMIDEYQDTNPVQFQLAEMLAAKYGNLCVVGDDDQAIYGWRGADVKNILQFERAKVIKLEQNYRSTNSILKAANGVIAHNSSRYPKRLWSQMGEGDPIDLLISANEEKEAEAIAYMIAKLKEQKGVRFSDIAILYRSNALSRNLEIALLKQTWMSGNHIVQGIPFEIFGGVEFYERREVKDLLAYLRVIINPRDEEALLRIINLPRRGIGEALLDALTAQARSSKAPLMSLLEDHQGVELSSKAKNNLAHFLSTLATARMRLQSEKPSHVLKWLVEAIRFRKAIEEEVKSDKMRAFKWENVEELINQLAHYEEQHPDGTLTDFVSSLTLQMQMQHFAKEQERSERVSLMTFHSAKGLEFAHCFLVGVEDHLIPHEKSLKETGIEEERRLMYVALTRAKKQLCISMAMMRRRMGQESPGRPSRFMHEIPKELLKRVTWD